MKKATIFTALGILFSLILSGCATTNTASRGQADRGYPAENPQSPGKKEVTSPAPESVNYGKAAFYSESARGKLTASGESYNPAQLTAAHTSLPFGSICRVTNMTNGKTVEVRVNDRFSGSGGRVILLSYEAANRLNAIQAGIIEVKVEVLKIPRY